MYSYIQCATFINLLILKLVIAQIYVVSKKHILSSVTSFLNLTYSRRFYMNRSRSFCNPRPVPGPTSGWWGTIWLRYAEWRLRIFLNFQQYSECRLIIIYVFVKVRQTCKLYSHNYYVSNGHIISQLGTWHIKKY